MIVVRNIGLMSAIELEPYPECPGCPHCRCLIFFGLSMTTPLLQDVERLASFIGAVLPPLSPHALKCPDPIDGNESSSAILPGECVSTQTSVIF